MVQDLWFNILQECTYAFTAAYTGSLVSATQWDSRKTQQELIPFVLSSALACCGIGTDMVAINVV